MTKKWMITIFASLLVALGAALAQDAAEPMTRADAEQQLVQVLEGGIETIATQDFVLVLSGYRESLEAEVGDDGSMEVLAVAVRTAEDAFFAEPFEQANAVEALKELALALRIVAGDSDEPLTTELASLLDQAAAYLEGGDYTPRMEVETP